MATVTLDLPAPAGYKPRRMGLTIPRRDNPFRVALALAANRAGKIAKLHQDGCADLAARYQADLHADCEHFLAAHPDRPPRFAVALREAATPTVTIPAPVRFADGAAVEIPGGLTGRVSHTYTADGQRRCAINVTRVSDPPHARHGRRWPEQYHADQSRLTPISDDAVAEYPVVPA